MKFSKVILILALFFTSFSFIYAYQGNSDISSNYSLNFNIGHSIVFYNETTNSTHNSEQIITLKPYSTNYFTRAGNVFFDFGMSTYYNVPQVSILNLQNNADYNLTKLSINISGEFFKDIETLSYSINGINYDLTSSVTGRVLNGKLDLPYYGNNDIDFVFTDIYGIPGTYSLSINAILNLPSLINDSDADGINDINDTIFGNVTNINTNLDSLTLEIDSDTNLSRLINETYNTTFKSLGNTVIEFANNYSANPINLSEVIIKQENTINNTKLLIAGLDLEVNNTKILYLNLSGDVTKYRSLCLKDAEIFSFTQISSGCNLSDETYVQVIPYSDDNYTIDFVDYVLNKTVKIDGLQHSAVEQLCTEDWDYGTWSCFEDYYRRSATDLNNCGTELAKEDVLGEYCGSSGGSPSGGGGPFTLYEPPIEEDNETDTSSSSSNNNNPVIEIPTSNNVESGTTDDSLANNDADNADDLDSDSTSGSTNTESTINISDYTTYIFAAVGLIILIGLVVFVKNNMPEKKQAPPPMQLSTFERDYKVVKAYVQKYKVHYQSDEIYRELEKAGYSHEVINKVFNEEF